MDKPSTRERQEEEGQRTTGKKIRSLKIDLDHPATPQTDFLKMVKMDQKRIERDSTEKLKLSEGESRAPEACRIAAC